MRDTVIDQFLFMIAQADKEKNFKYKALLEAAFAKYKKTTKRTVDAGYDIN